MTSKKTSKRSRANFLAELVTVNRKPCTFCGRDVDEEATYGKLYAIGDIQCHYFCVLLSCCLIQKGKDHDGLFGFLYPDILAEVERSKKHRCSYCSRGGATIGCSVSQCRKQFHLPCGRARNAVSLFYGNYKSYCQDHAPKQTVSENIKQNVMLRAREGKKKSKKAREKEARKEDVVSIDKEMLCVICFEEVDGYPTTQTFWPPCCARDAWLHRACLQRIALSAGMHHLKCPLCNDKDMFYRAVVGQGYYIPDRDASWELEQNAFADLYERPVTCDVEQCQCPLGRDHDTNTGPWDIRPCLLCGGGGHAQCLGERPVCAICLPAAPKDLDQLAPIPPPAPRPAGRSGPLMPSRMSLRRTKQRLAHTASSSSSQSRQICEAEANSRAPSTVLQGIENTLLSPVKHLERGLSARQPHRLSVAPGQVMDVVREWFRRPRPLSAKKRVIEDMIENLLNGVDNADKGDMSSDIKVTENEQHTDDVNADIQNAPIVPKGEVDIENNIDQYMTVEQKDAENAVHDKTVSQIDEIPLPDVPEQNDGSPTIDAKSKTVDIKTDSTMEISENDEVINIDLVEIEPSESVMGIDTNNPEDACAYKFSPIDKEVLQKNNIDFDLESFKNQYLNEVGRDFVCPFNHKYDTANDSNLNSVIDSAVKAALKKETDNVSENANQDSTPDKKQPKKNTLKRKIQTKRSETKHKKKRREKKDKIILKCKRNKDDTNLRRKLRAKRIKTRKLKGIDTVDVTLDVNTQRRKSMKKLHTKLSLKDKNIKVKIKLNFFDEEASPKTMKQCVLNNRSEQKLEFTKPEHDVTPLKRKYKEHKKSPDNLKQMSIQNFFKATVLKEEIN